jgi:WD40 repeat protein
MKRTHAALWSLLLLFPTPSPLQAQQSKPSYAREVRPFLAKYCVECHNPGKLKGGLNLESYKALREGAESGPVVVPGKADESPLVLLTEKKEKPHMPPKEARRFPSDSEVAVLRAWVNAGATDDSGSIVVAIPDVKPRKPAAAPVNALVFHPAGKLLLAGVYQDLVLVDAERGKLVHSRSPLREGTQEVSKSPIAKRITALTWSRDGTRLAVAVCQPGVSGSVRRYRGADPRDLAGQPTLSAHQDTIADMAFDPAGKVLATCSYDRTVKLWDAASGALLHTLKEHSDAVYGVAFRPDGKWLASAAADRAVKVFDVETGKLLTTLGDATDWLYAVAWSPDGKHVAAGGVDRSIRVWEVTAEGGKVVHSVFAHEAPVTRLIYSADGKTLYSLGEDRKVKVWDADKMVERKVYPPQPEAVLALAVRPDGKQLALGRFDGALLLLGEKTFRPLPGQFDQVKEQEPNDSPGTGQRIVLPVAVGGSLNKAGDVDFYRFEANAGDEIGVQVVTDSKNFSPVLQLTGPDGEVVSRGDDVLGYTCPKAGTYALGVHDREYRGGVGMTYRLRVGPVPVITSVFPLGLQRGTEGTFALEGVNLVGVRAVKIKADANAAVGARLPVNVTTPYGPALGNKSVVVGEFPEVSSDTTLSVDTLPRTVNGRIEQPGATQSWRFPAKKGERLLLEVNARRLGSALDSFLEILDEAGKPVPRAVLRCQAKTNVTFRDHDSVGAGIRIEAWTELATNDYIYVGSELLRIKNLPPNPDADCEFYSRSGQRLGFLDTTPTHLSMGTPMYKVSIHPPGTTFPPNGMPVFALAYRNDDGGPGFGRDSRLHFEAPADGVYQVRVGDARGLGGSNFAYRLTIRPPRPDFKVSFNPANPTVWKGGAVPVSAAAERIDGFDREIGLRLENLPVGFSAPESSIPKGENSTTFALWADANAAAPAKATPPPKLVAWAMIDGKKVVREVQAGLPQVKDPGDLTTATEQSEVTVKPGGQVRLTVKIERRNDFKGRVPLDVRGLPHGVRVLDVGLNGILITETETVRTIVIAVEPWVEATAHPFVVLSRQERKGTEHAAKSVLLKVAP